MVRGPKAVLLIVWSRILRNSPPLSGDEVVYNESSLPLQRGSSVERKAILEACKDGCIAFSALVLMDFFDQPDTHPRRAT